MTLTAAITVSASTGGRGTTAARTLTTVPVRRVTTVPPVTTASPPSSANVHTGAQVPLSVTVRDVPHTRVMILMKVLNVMIHFDEHLLLWCSQVCCATLTMPASAIHVKRAPTVTPTQSMARQSAPVLQVIPGQLATWTLTSAPLVSQQIFLLV